MGRFNRAPPTKNPGALAGATGVPKGSGGKLEQTQTYSRNGAPARLTFRSVFNDDGHFQGLEVAS